jgi:hypothetical protein
MKPYERNTLMVTVYGVKPADGGFGMYQRHVEGVEFPGFDSVEEYTSHVIAENTSLELIVDTDDEHATVDDADGKIYDQNGGTVVGWLCKADRETIILELVYV